MINTSRAILVSGTARPQSSIATYALSLTVVKIHAKFYFKLGKPTF